MKLLTTAQVAELTRIRPRTLFDYRKAGLLTAVKVRTRVYFRAEDVEAFLREHLQGAKDAK